MIARPAPRLVPERAARRAARGRRPVWLATGAPTAAARTRDFVACDPVEVVRGGSVDELARAWARQRAAWGGGAGIPIGIGYLGYDLGRSLLPKLGPGPHLPSPFPDLEFRFYDALWTRGAADAEIWAVDDAAAARLGERLAGDGREEHADEDAAPVVGRLEPAEPPARHLEAVRRALAYIRAGDVYQVNLARRLQAEVRGPAALAGLAFAGRLSREAPAPFALWLAAAEDEDEDGGGGWALVGNSPERFLRVDPAGVVETCPIKGTRPRALPHGGPADRAAIAALAASAKDRAEHAMIVDLERNDLGRVCETGSVAPVDLFQPLALPTVHHLVSTVRGRLRPEVGLPELLAATFPGGSITGAPKLRAMQIIDELEPARRGPYTGATGWLGAAGDLDLAVAIRTAWVRGGALTVWVGGGVVADSDPEAELDETRVKAEAFRRLCEG